MHNIVADVMTTQLGWQTVITQGCVWTYTEITQGHSTTLPQEMWTFMQHCSGYNGTLYCPHKCKVLPAFSSNLISTLCSLYDKTMHLYVQSPLFHIHSHRYGDLLIISIPRTVWKN